MKEKTVEDAQEVLEFTEAIQSSAGVEVGEMLKNTMQVKREPMLRICCFRCWILRGNVSRSSLSDPINLDPTSPTYNTANLDDIPLSRV